MKTKTGIIMEKTIIGLKGKANVGKSMTLSRLGRQLRNAGGVTQDDIDKSEYWAVFEYQGVKIGVQTYGDHVNDVSAGIAGFLDRQCAIIVTASKTTGDTVDHLNQVAGTNGYRIIWARPYEVGDGSIAVEVIKEYGASHLLRMINDIISGII